MKYILDSAVHLFTEVSTHVLGHIAADKAIKHIDNSHSSAGNGEYRLIRDRLDQIALKHLDANIEVQRERLELEGTALKLQQQFAKEYLAQVCASQQSEINLRLSEIQSYYDEKNWSGILSRQETVSLLKSFSTLKPRLLMVVSEPDVSESCPQFFRDDLGREVRGKLKQFLEGKFSASSDCPVEFFGKFFKSSVFDTEVKQIERVLVPLHLATIFSDVTRKEVMFHLRLSFGNHESEFSFATAFPWRDEQRKLVADGMAEHDSLEVIQDSIVSIYQLLAAFLADSYFLHRYPMYEPRLFSLKVSSFPEAWMQIMTSSLRAQKEAQLRKFEQELKEKSTATNNAPRLSPPRAAKPWEEWPLIGKYRVKDAIAVDVPNGLMWLRFTVGQRWSGGAGAGDPKEVKFLRLQENIDDFNRGSWSCGYNDWRLPTIEELKTLIDKYEGNAKKKIMCTDNEVFPGTPIMLFSSADVRLNGERGGYVVDFGGGSEIFVQRSTLIDAALWARLVRSL